MNYDFSGVDAPKNNKDLYGLRYAEFVVPLVKAVQELATTNDALQSQIANLQNQINQLKGNTSTANSITSSSTARLEQNNPNPFNSSTTIHYYLPNNIGNAFINIYSGNGSVMKSMPLGTKVSGQITVKPGELTSGVYYYTLMVDGKTVDSKQMILTK